MVPGQLEVSWRSAAGLLEGSWRAAGEQLESSWRGERVFSDASFVEACTRKTWSRKRKARGKQGSRGRGEGRAAGEPQPGHSSPLIYLTVMNTPETRAYVPRPPLPHIPCPAHRNGALKSSASK